MASSIPNFSNTEIAFKHLSDKQLKFSIRMFQLINSPFLSKLGMKLANFGVKAHLPVSGMIKATLFRQFCGGESMNECDQVIVQLGKNNIGAILDYAIEGADRDKVFDHVTDELIRVIRKAEKNPNIPVSCMKLTGVGRFELFRKLTEKEELKEIEKLEFGKVVQRVQRICQAAHDAQVPIYIDAEESWIQDAIDRLAESMMRQFNKEQAIVFTTLQMYRWDKLGHLKKLLKEAQQEQFIVGVKFVRGAYLEKENNRAQENGYKSPIQPNKESTDKDFNAALELAVKQLEHIEFCAGTHNQESCEILTQLMNEAKLPNNHAHIFFSQLYGMSDNLSYNLSNAGYKVSKYLPYGPVKATVPYLTRRAEENTSISGQMSNELGLLMQELKRRKGK